MNKSYLKYILENIQGVKYLYEQQIDWLKDAYAHQKKVIVNDDEWVEAFHEALKVHGFMRNNHHEDCDE